MSDSALEQWGVAFRQWWIAASRGEFAALQISMEVYQASCALNAELESLDGRTKKLKRSAFLGYREGSREVVEVSDSSGITEIQILPDATREELRGAITYMVGVIDQLTNPDERDRL